MDKAHWVEVSLTTDGELAEAVASVLTRYVTKGAVIESKNTNNNAEDTGTPKYPVRVFGYLSNDEHLEVNRKCLDESIWHLSQIMPLPEPSYRTIEDEDWIAPWKEHYHPIPIGQRLLILPSWTKPRNSNRLPIFINPSLAFGSGTHPTTILCLEMMEEYIHHGERIIDVGCGSGILSIAALKLGASCALGVDINNAAILATQENAAANSVENLLEIGLGSVKDILQGEFSFNRAPMVLANILAPTIISLLENGLPELVSPLGMIILSGILLEQVTAVETVANLHNLKLIKRRQIDDWIALVFQLPYA